VVCGTVKVVGVEPESAPTLSEALKAGRPVGRSRGGIAADSLAPRRVGELMFQIAQAHVARVALVSDAAIRRAQDALWSAVRIVAEPGGAAALAALLGGAYVPAVESGSRSGQRRQLHRGRFRPRVTASTSRRPAPRAPTGSRSALGRPAGAAVDRQDVLRAGRQRDDPGPFPPGTRRSFPGRHGLAHASCPSAVHGMFMKRFSEAA